MANLIADYRLDLDALLATAVDTATWTTAVKDQGLRMAMDQYDMQQVYESSFTVTVTGYQQDLSTIAGICHVVALAYPWVDGMSFDQSWRPSGLAYDRGAHGLAEWRMVGVQLVYFSNVQPVVGEVIRVRYKKQHAIQGLDGAAATTVPDRDRSMVGLLAASWCLDLRVRQISENPALPLAAANELVQLRDRYQDRAKQMMSYMPPVSTVRWQGIGL